MTLMEHLEELRMRLIWALAFLLLGCVGGFFLAKPAVYWLVEPFSDIKIKRKEELLKLQLDLDSGNITLGKGLTTETLQSVSPYRIGFYLPSTPLDEPPDFVWGQNMQKPIFLNPLDPITLYFKAAVIVGVILALPFVLFQVWLFVGPGLHSHERKILLSLLGFACILFPTGVLFARFIFTMVLDFLLNFQVMNMEPQLEIFRFVNLELRMMLGFGVVFELPLAIMLLTFLGIVNPRQLRQYRSHVIVAIAFLSMIFTPPDPISMLLMMLPLIMLYEVSIWASVPLARKRNLNHDASEPSDSA